MDIEEYFKDNKKLIYIMGALYIVAMVFVIYFIWKPESNDNAMVKYTPVDDKKLQEKIVNEYAQNIAFNFVLGESNVIKEMLNPGYLAYRKISSDNMIDELTKKGFFSLDTQIKDIKQYILGDVYVYKGILTNNKRDMEINIIETYPYEYTIAFDDFYKYSEISEVFEAEGIKFDIKERTYGTTHVDFKIKITNTDNKYAIFNLNKASLVVLGLENGTEYEASMSVQDVEKKTDLNINSSEILDVMFRVPLQNHEKIAYIKFKNVQFDGMEDDIIVNI